MNAASPQWEAWTARATAIDAGEVAARLGAKLRRSGPDLVGHCPLGCTTHGDGFIVTPKKGIFLCRPSGSTGDVIEMTKHLLGCGFAEALEAITGEQRPDRSRDETAEQRARREAAALEREAAAQARQAEEERTAAAKQRRDEDAVGAILARAIPIAGTGAEAYLRARGLNPARRLLGDLRFVAELDYWGWEDDAARKADVKTHLATQPAMVAVIRDVGGGLLGIHQTFLDQVEPRKWKPTGSAENGAKKVRKVADSVTGGLIRLGMLGDKLAMGEGIETTLSWHALGFGPEDITLAATISLGNMAGRSTGSVPHPTATGPNGKPVSVRNGEPDIAKPGVLLPNDVREVILLGDSDSEPMATRGAVLTAARRFRAQGRTVAVHWSPAGLDWNDVLRRQLVEMEHAA